MTLEATTTLCCAVTLWTYSGICDRAEVHGDLVYCGHAIHTESPTTDELSVTKHQPQLSRIWLVSVPALQAVTMTVAVVWVTSVVLDTLKGPINERIINI